MKRKMGWLLSLILLLSIFGNIGVASAAGDVGYYIKGSVNESAGTFLVDIYVQNAKVLGGRLGLGFETDFLELEEPITMNSVLKAGSSIRLNTESMSADKLMSNEGYVGFGWNPMYSALDATKTDRLIATVKFRLKDGVTASDFDNEAVRLLRVNQNENWGWKTPASIWDYDLRDYDYAVPGSLPCAVGFEYPNSDVISTRARRVKIQLENGEGAPLTGTVQFNGETLEVIGGSVETRAVRGTYACLASAPGYETKYEEVEITDHQTVRIRLRTEQDVAEAAAAALEIGYGEGEHAQYVKTNLVLPATGLDGCTVSWSSDRSVVVSEFGNVYPLAEDAEVTLTATVRYGTAEVQRVFQIKVIGTGSKEKPWEIDPIAPTDSTESDKTPSEAGFTDLNGYPWAREAIDNLAKAGVIAGTSKTTFSPGATVTRGDFMALLMRMLDPDGALDGDGFIDVPKESYYYKEIQLAKGLGIASGTGDGMFNPRSNVNRQDMVTLTYRALEQLGILGAGAPQADLNRFKDAGLVSAYAREAMAVMVEFGAISGNTDGTVNPLGSATRAETAVFLYRIYQQL
jgi:hypothetical protein